MQSVLSVGTVYFARVLQIVFTWNVRRIQAPMGQLKLSFEGQVEYVLELKHLRESDNK